MRNASLTIQTATVVLSIFVFFFSPIIVYGDIDFDGGVSEKIDYFVDGNVWIFDASVSMYEPAFIQGYVITGSGTVLDIYGGQIETMLWISSDNNALPEGIVTVYGTDFKVNGVPVSPDTTEILLNGEYLSGIYEDGTPFNFLVSCIMEGTGDYAYYQTIKLGWIASQPDIELSVDQYDFGQTYINETQTGIVTIYNLGDAALTVQDLSIEDDDYGEFSIPSVPLPFTIDPNTGGVDIEVFYTPAAEGISEATFKVFSDDPNDPNVMVDLIGEGIPTPPEQQIQDILDAYDIAVVDGSILGIGNKKSAANKVKAFGKMLSVVDDLIAEGYYGYALDILSAIEAKCDGEKAPKDFIKGDAVEQLDAQINELINTLQE